MPRLSKQSASGGGGGASNSTTAVPGRPKKVASRPSSSSASAEDKLKVPSNPGSAVASVVQSQIRSVTDSVSRTDKSRPRGNTLEDQPWYHGLIPREDINKMLRKQGDFLVRDTEVDGERRYVISVFWDEKAKHVVIQHSPARGYAVDPTDAAQRFPSVTALVMHYHTKKLPLPTFPYVLSNPLPRQSWELRHNQITLKKKLGEGAFGEVYKGELRRTDGKMLPVAVKRSSEDQHLSKEQVKELMGEMRLMQKLNHKNIVRFYGVAAEQQPVMIVMELVNGGSLDSYLQKNIGKISAYLKLKFCTDTACGMTYLHTRQPPQIHRDIAARNCLVADGSTIKVADFGLAIEGHTYKMSKNVKVPIRWLAPETLKTASYSLKTDVWSFAITVWEIYMDGTEPYPGMNAAEVGAAVKNGYKIDFRKVEAMPADVRAVIVQCIETKPSDRPDFGRIESELNRLLKKSNTRRSVTY